MHVTTVRGRWYEIFFKRKFNARKCLDTKILRYVTMKQINIFALKENAKEEAFPFFFLRFMQILSREKINLLNFHRQE